MPRSDRGTNVCDIYWDETESSGVGMSKVTATTPMAGAQCGSVPHCVCDPSKWEEGRGEQRV